MVWEELAEVEELARGGHAVRVRGRYTVHPRFGPADQPARAAPAEPGSFDPEDLRRRPGA